MIRTVIIGILTIALGSAGYYYLSTDHKKAIPIPVKMEPVVYGEFVASVSAEGKVIARKKETLVSPITGVVRDNDLSVGTNLFSGEVIAYIHPPEEELRKKKQEYDFARIDLDILAEQFRESKILLKAKAISEREFRELEIRKLKQERLVQNLREELVDKPVECRFGGIMVQKKFNDRDRVSAGEPLAVVVDTRSFVAQVDVPQHILPSVYLGQRVKFTSETFPVDLRGTVIEMPRTASDGTDANAGIASGEPKFEVIATIERPSTAVLLLEARLTAEFILSAKQNALSVPLEAVLIRNEKPAVFVASSGYAAQRFVTLGPANNLRVEVTAGLDSTDTVITAGNVDLGNGTAIRDMEDEKSVNHREFRSKPGLFPQ